MKVIKFFMLVKANVLNGQMPREAFKGSFRFHDRKTALSVLRAHAEKCTSKGIGSIGRYVESFVKNDEVWEDRVILKSYEIYDKDGTIGVLVNYEGQERPKGGEWSPSTRDGCNWDQVLWWGFKVIEDELEIAESLEDALG